ncbi:MAG: hypothetical protein KUF77_09780 [Candidatus Thiodiazotropha sp. (ex Lucina aurantia)]|nr:hypothetical protein [Candidatus Thiodiazotropha taylori]MBV2097828.1 hypothetical protein [Candidatus Thiodiazotropha sp. (ex Codakia orbicularis)]MBV2103299.1 hypothetical protein [Candidatus Thiodiazotropha sp. (ex Lucina aurantia)]MBV2116338.1 hypothetical protein [Candidatus Thiodiazotropha sp. (ex Lucina aurantia)]
MSMDDIREKVEKIVTAFVTEEVELLMNNSSEQAITHRLAVMLERDFNDWNVDCEYNRDQNTIKRLRYAISADRPIEERDVVPDIIVHQRMTENNLLVIEVKKSTNPEPDVKDLAKLHAFREQLGYKNALFIRFLVGADEPNVQRMEWV